MKVFTKTAALFISIILLFSISIISHADTEAEKITLSAEIAKVYGARSGIITMTFDDGYFDTALVVDSLLEKYGLTGTVMMLATNTDSSAERDRWRELFKSGRLEVQSHSMTHIGFRGTEDAENMNEDTYKYEILESQKMLSECFPAQDIIAYAIPYGIWTDEPSAVAMTSYYMVRSTVSGKQTLDPGFGINQYGDWSAIYSPSVDAFPSGTAQIDVLKGWVDTAAEGYWYCPIAHRVGDMEGTEMPYSVANEFFAYIEEAKNDGKVWVTTVSRATKYIRERQNTSISATLENGEVLLKAELAEKTEDGLDLDPAVFNHPLTVRVDLPIGYSGTLYYLDGCTEKSAEIISMGAENYVYIDVVPNGKTVKITKTHFGEDEKVHTFTSATCENPKTCTVCGKEEGDTLPHTPSEATCILPPICTVCKKVCGTALGHKYRDATCIAPKTCEVCGDTRGNVSKTHNYEAASCEKPKTCKDCLITEGEPLPHDFEKATCIYPKICKSCGVSDGEPLGHDCKDASCTEPKVCLREGCSYTEGEPTGHDFEKASCTLPRVCKSCAMTEGEPLGHSTQLKPLDGGKAHAEVCSVCGYTENSTAHADENGDRICDGCGYEMTPPAPQAPPNDKTEGSNNPTDSESSGGNESGEFIPIIISASAAVAVTAFALLFIFKLKKKK